jgi:hypothetical protein
MEFLWQMGPCYLKYIILSDFTIKNLMQMPKVELLHFMKKISKALSGGPKNELVWAL